jgi:hypothetical protein
MQQLYVTTHPGFLKYITSSFRPARAGKLTTARISLLVNQIYN